MPTLVHLHHTVDFIYKPETGKKANGACGKTDRWDKLDMNKLIHESFMNHLAFRNVAFMKIHLEKWSYTTKAPGYFIKITLASLKIAYLFQLDTWI